MDKMFADMIRDSWRTLLVLLVLLVVSSWGLSRSLTRIAEKLDDRAAPPSTEEGE